jgi:2-acylglycerol O-acyltransferase 2
MLKKWGFVVPVFWGPRWYAPFLPRSDVALNTVVGSPLKLPTIAEPTNEEVALWHAKYIAALTEIFDTYKHRFGYGDRVLEVL